MSGGELRRGKVHPITLLGQSVLLGRKTDGSVFAMRNLCPHRSTPLHHGSFDGNEVQCRYHGWKFNSAGNCTLIPGLLEPQEHLHEGIRNKTYPCREQQGAIWVYVGEKLEQKELPPILMMPGIGDVAPQAYCSLSYPLNGEHAAYTFFDPSHVAFVHSSPLIRRRSHSIKDKIKEYEPVPLGWRMKRRPVPPENFFYRLFGRNATTEISYLLPGTRIESIQGEKHCAVSLATIAPAGENETIIHQAMYWTFPYLGPFRGLVRHFIHHFLDEDREYALWQKEGLQYQRPFMLVGDADAQIRWFQRLRSAWLKAEAEKMPFENPLKPETLRFRS